MRDMMASCRGVTVGAFDTLLENTEREPGGTYAVLFIAQAEVKTPSIELNFNSWPGGGLAATGGAAAASTTPSGAG